MSEQREQDHEQTQAYKSRASAESCSQADKLFETVHLSGESLENEKPNSDNDLKQLGRYEIRRVLGEGSFGAVYRGYDQQLKRDVAIKVPHLSQSKEIIDEFLAEAQQLAQLKHPSIVSVFDVGVEDGRCYIVSDYLHGPPVDKWLRENRPTCQTSVQIVISLADALAHAHARRIVHRDLKPGNVIMTDDLGPVLVDFGLAVSDEHAASQRGFVSGTPAYMSPEQTRGEGHRVDGRTSTPWECCFTNCLLDDCRFMAARSTS